MTIPDDIAKAAAACANEATRNGSDASDVARAKRAAADPTYSNLWGHVVRRARAFLAGQDAPSEVAGAKVAAEQPTAPQGEWGPQSREVYPDTPQGLVDETNVLRAERDALQAELEAERESHWRTRGDWSAAVDRLTGELAAEKAAHEATRKELADAQRTAEVWEKSANQHMARGDSAEREMSKLRAELAAEDEAHAVTRAHLADVGKVLAASGGESPFDAARRVRGELDALRAGVEGLVGRWQK